MRTRFLLGAVATWFSLCSVAIAQLPYPQPFPGTINSAFGPRNLQVSPFHGGLDYRQAAGTPIPAPANGYLSEIKTDSNAGGIRLYLNTNDGVIDLGYMHLFSYKDPVRKSRSGDFVLLKQKKFVAMTGVSALRIASRVATCDTILNTRTGIALVPKACDFAVGQKMTLDPLDAKKLYTVTNEVRAGLVWYDASGVQQFTGTWIAPVGDSSSNTISPHSHIQHGRSGGVDHPLKLFQDVSNIGSYCARLATPGDNPPYTAPNCIAPLLVPTFNQASIADRNFIDIQVDSTSRLDLDGLTFVLSSTPPQAYSVRFSSPKRLINGNPATIDDLKAITDSTCDSYPSSGALIICPKSWQGQQVATSNLEQVYRLGVDWSKVPLGDNKVVVTLLKAKGGTISVPLQFRVVAFDGTYIGTSTLSDGYTHTETDVVSGITVVGRHFFSNGFTGSYTNTSTLKDGYTHIETDTVSGNTISGQHSFSNGTTSGSFVWQGGITLSPSDAKLGTIIGSGTINNQGTRSFNLTGNISINTDGSADLNWSGVDPKFGAIGWTTHRPPSGGSFIWQGTIAQLPAEEMRATINGSGIIDNQGTRSFMLTGEIRINTDGSADLFWTGIDSKFGGIGWVTHKPPN